MRYIKQVKVRSGKAEFGAYCVPVFTLEKFDNAVSLGIVQNLERPPVNNFLGFRFMEFGYEEDHLHTPPAKKHIDNTRSAKKKSVIKNVKRLAAEGKTAGKIAAELQIPKSTAFRYMQMT